MAQAVSRRPVTAEARVRSQVSPCVICGGRSGTGTVFSPNTSDFPCQFHSTGSPLLGKTKKTFIFIIELHNKPQGCYASVASAAGLFTKKIYQTTACHLPEGLSLSLPLPTILVHEHYICRSK